MVIDMLVVLQSEVPMIQKVQKFIEVFQKDIKQTRLLTSLTYDRWDVRCVSRTGAEHPDERRDSADHQEGREVC